MAGSRPTKPNTVGSLAEARAPVSRTRMIISRASSAMMLGRFWAQASRAARGRARISLSRMAMTVAVCAVPAIRAISPTGSPERTMPTNCCSRSSLRSTPSLPDLTK